MLLSEAASKYRDYIRGERVLAITTCEGYISNLNAYARWLDEQGLPDPDASVALSADLVRRYQASLVGRKLKASAVRSCLFPVRGVSAFLFEAGVLSRDETRDVKLPAKNPGYRPKANDSDVVLLLSAPERLFNRRKSAMMSAYLNTLAQVGLRRAEAYDLRVADLNREEGSVLVRYGKGGKTRTLFPPEEYWQVIDRWLDVRAEMGCTHDWLFAQNRARRYSYDALGRLMHEAKRLVGLEGKAFGAHSLRHNWARYYEKRGVSLDTLRVALGHSDIRTTTIYLHTDIRDVQEMARIPGRRSAAAETLGPPPVKAPAITAVTMPEPSALPKPSRHQQVRQMRRRVPNHSSA